VLRRAFSLPIHPPFLTVNRFSRLLFPRRVNRVFLCGSSLLSLFPRFRDLSPPPSSCCVDLNSPCPKDHRISPFSVYRAVFPLRTHFFFFSFLSPNQGSCFPFFRISLFSSTFLRATLVCALLAKTRSPPFSDGGAPSVQNQHVFPPFVTLCTSPSFLQPPQDCLFPPEG